MADRYRIRPATAADLTALTAIERAVFADPWSREMLSRSLDDLALVAEDERGAVVGYVLARATADEGEILNLAVDPGQRRRGMGRQLAETVLGMLRLEGVRRVFLEVRESNLGARSFYAMLGFRELGRRRGYYARPREDALVLVCSTASDTAMRKTGQDGVSLIDKRT